MTVESNPVSVWLQVLKQSATGLKMQASDCCSTHCEWMNLLRAQRKADHTHWASIDPNVSCDFLIFLLAIVVSLLRPHFGLNLRTILEIMLKTVGWSGNQLLVTLKSSDIALLACFHLGGKRHNFHSLSAPWTATAHSELHFTHFCSHCQFKKSSVIYLLIYFWVTPESTFEGVIGCSFVSLCFFSRSNDVLLTCSSSCTQCGAAGASQFIAL